MYTSRNAGIGMPPRQSTATPCSLTSRVMTEAPFPAVSLKVPLAVDARAAQNWDEAH